MGTPELNVHQQIIEKTKNLALKTQVQVLNLEKKCSIRDHEVDEFNFVSGSWF